MDVANKMGLDARKPVFGVFRTTQKQTSLRISAFVIHVLESVISKLATHEISVFQLVSVAEETGFSLTLSETPKSGLVVVRPKCHNIRPNKKIPVFRLTRPYVN